MKRDMELLRSILLEIESTDRLSGAPVIEDRAIVGHLLLLSEAGLIDGMEVIQAGDGSTSVLILPFLRITSAGHDFLDAIRSDEVWTQTKSRIATAGVGVTLAVITELATAFVKEKLGLR